MPTLTVHHEKPLELPPARVFLTVPLESIRDNPWQPRAALDQAQIAELANSIRERGLLQPPMLRRVWPADDEVYQLAYGHYRVAALRSLGWTHVVCEVRELSDRDMALTALEENTKRKDVTPIEQYRAWARALEIEGMSVEQLAQGIGLERSTVANNLRLLKLPAQVLQYVDAGELSAHGAREFLCLLGADGHFHDDLAKTVLSQLTSGAPDWRVARIRKLIQEAVSGSSVADWRKLFKGHAGGGHQADPSFDVDEFSRLNAAKVHAIPADEWETDHGTPGYPRRPKKELSQSWTCATAAWRREQGASGKTATAIAKSTPGAAGRTASFGKQLAQDPVFLRVSQETEVEAKKLINVLAADKPKGPIEQERANQVKAKLGTRAEPQLLNKGGFKAYVDPHERYVYSNNGETAVPSYFPNIAECRKSCTIGATYGRFSADAPLALYCLNQQHFEEKVAAGRARVEAKVQRQVEAIDSAQAKLYDQLALLKWQLDAPALRLLAAVLMSDRQYVAVEPVNVDYRERGELARWPANVRRIHELAGLDLPLIGAWGRDDNQGRWQALQKLEREALQELVLCLLVNMREDRNGTLRFEWP